MPRAAVGVVIGKGGEMIKKIQSSTGAKLQFEQGRDDGPGDRKCILTGKPEQCEDAREKVMELIDSVQVYNVPFLLESANAISLLISCSFTEAR